MPPENVSPPPAKDNEEDQAQAPSPADSRSEEGEARSGDDDDSSSGQDVQDKQDNDHSHDATASYKKGGAADAPPLPEEPIPGQGLSAVSSNGDNAPPLPTEAPPQQADDGWEPQWDATHSAWYFYNRFTGMTQWDNPRVPTAGSSTTAAPGISAAAAAAISQPASVAGGYNPAIHGSWDPDAPYAQAYKAGDEEYEADLAAYNAEMMADVHGDEAAGGELYMQNAAFNRGTGKVQTGDQNPERYSDASKSYRQMNAYFNVDQAANSHDGRSLKAERRGKQPTRKELATWKEKRKARKEEKRRAWLRD